MSGWVRGSALIRAMAPVALAASRASPASADSAAVEPAQPATVEPAFLPAGWTGLSGTVLLIPRNETVRPEFAPAGQPVSATCCRECRPTVIKWERGI